MNAVDRMKELTALLNEAARVYYNEDREIMSNQAYDTLIDDLAALEAECGIILSNSPTQTVGFDAVGSLRKVPHDTPMLSLDKTKSVVKLREFLQDQTGLLSWKLDGLTIVLRYENGGLQQAVTRGNGEVGEDVTHNARVFHNIPIKIGYTGVLILRGEAVIGYAAFDRINSELPPEEKYKNPRNLCSGTVRQLSNETTARRDVDFFVFSLIQADGVDFADSKAKQNHWLKEMGFETVETRVVTADSIEGAVLDFESRAAGNDFGCDGLVLTYDGLAYSESLGSTSKFPRDSLAFKWADEPIQTQLRQIIWNTARTGVITPVAVFDPVEIDGATVNKASLHNVSAMQSLKLGLGDIITVYKANKIIPQVAENLTRSDTEAFPKLCPACGERAEIIGENESKALYCTNPNCKAQQIRSLTHFTSRDAMNIAGLSRQTLEKFVEQGFIENYTDIYFLQEFAQDIAAMKGFGPKSLNKLLDAIERSKDTALANFIYALGICQVGLSNAKLLCGYYNNDIEQILAAHTADLTRIEGFSDVISQSVYSYISNERNIMLLRKILPLLRFTQRVHENNAPLAGLSFVITGDVSLFSNRKALETYIESLGGKTTGSVSAKTGYLINNDSLSESAKNKKAKSLQIPILTETEFIDKFNLQL